MKSAPTKPTPEKAPETSPHGPPLSATRMLYNRHPFGNFDYSNGRISMHPQLRDWLHLVREEGPIAEVGCGGGDWLRAALVAGCSPDAIVAIDAAEAPLNALRKEGFTVTCGDAAGLPFPDNSFAHVLCYGVLHHMAQPFAGFSELARICRPGGLICIAVYNWRMPLPWLLHLIGTPWRWAWQSGYTRAVEACGRASAPLVWLAGLLLLGKRLDAQTASTIFMDHCINPHVKVFSRRKWLNAAADLGLEVVSVGYAGRGSLMVMVLRAPAAQDTATA